MDPCNPHKGPHHSQKPVVYELFTIDRFPYPFKDTPRSEQLLQRFLQNQSFCIYLRNGSAAFPDLSIRQVITILVQLVSKKSLYTAILQETSGLFVFEKWTAHPQSRKVVFSGNLTYNHLKTNSQCTMQHITVQVVSLQSMSKWLIPPALLLDGWIDPENEHDIHQKNATWFQSGKIFPSRPQAFTL